MTDPLALRPFAQTEVGHRPNRPVSKRSCWADAVWLLDHLPKSQSRSEARLHWGWAMSEGHFTDAPWAEWLEAAKQFLWSLRTAPLEGLSLASESTLKGRFHALRVLVQWMDREGLTRFAELDAHAAQRFAAHLRTRPGRHGPLSSATLAHYLYLLKLLYLQRGQLSDAPAEDPFPGQTAFEAAGRCSADGPHLPYTPDEIAIPLLKAALRLIGVPADEVIRLRDAALAAYEEAQALGCRAQHGAEFVVETIDDWRASILPEETVPWWQTPITGLQSIRFLQDRIVDACVIVILYLVGVRVSELCSLEMGCIEYHTDEGNEPVAYLVGKDEKIADARRRWVVPEPVVRAVEVLEKLSQPWREVADRHELLLIVQNPAGLHVSPTRIGHLSAEVINRRINKQFFPFIELPRYHGDRWPWSTHQGRKTFARFVGRRDRTGLDALAWHFGHLTRAMTSRHYVGTDFELQDLIDGEIATATADALREIYHADRLAGPRGREILQLRGRFVDLEVEALITQVITETDMRIGPCDWGYCVYRQETSACRGEAQGPNPVRRAPEVCAGCANFALTERHRPYWERRRQEHQAFLQYPIDPLNRVLCEQVITQADQLLAQLDGQEHPDDA